MKTIFFGAENKQADTPLLFVHGAYCNANIWAKYFLSYFASQGFYGAAIALSGHGETPEEKENLDFVGVADLLDDIAQGLSLFQKPAILIGHSMGGYLIQRYALSHDIRAQVLLSSPALTGLAGSSLHILTRAPDLAFQLGLLMAYGPRYADIDVIGKALCPGPITPSFHEEIAQTLQAESKRLISEIMWPVVSIPTHKPPTLVLGGTDDLFVPTSDMRLAAHFWDGDLELIPDVPHGLMLASCWQRVADEIIAWIKAH